MDDVCMCVSLSDVTDEKDVALSRLYRRYRIREIYQRNSVFVAFINLESSFRSVRMLDARVVYSILRSQVLQIY